MAGMNKFLSGILQLAVMVWDFWIFIANLLLPSLKPGHVVPRSAPGHNLSWPPYVAPTDGDSRSACPMLNAMANHGILPHDGKNITFKQLNMTVRQTFNFAPSFCFFAPKFAADYLNRSYWKDTFSLEELSLHADNAIEHDASLTRRDLYFEKDQGKPDLELVGQLLGEATAKAKDGSPLLTIPDLSRALGKRRVECRKTNPAYSETFFHNTFGAANSSTMLTIFGGLVDDLKPMLIEERFSEHWEPRILKRYGLTMAQFNGTVLPVESGCKKYVKAAAKQEL